MAEIYDNSTLTINHTSPRKTTKTFDDHPPSTSTNCSATVDQFDQMTQCLAILVIILNSILILFLVRSRSLRKKHSVKFFLNLQMVDILLATSYLLSFSFLCDPSSCSSSVCTKISIRMDIQSYIWLALLIEMFIFLVIYTMDRFVAIKYPYKYVTFTPKHVLALILAAWGPAFVLVAVAMIFVPSDGNFFAMSHYLSHVNTVLIACAALVLIVSNGIVYGIAKKQYQVIHRTTQQPPSTSSIHERRMLKSTYVCLCFVVSFVVSWLPVCVCNVVVMAGVVMTYPSVMEVLPHINSLCCPLFFVVFRRDVKKGMRKFVRQKRDVFRSLFSQGGYSS